MSPNRRELRRHEQTVRLYPWYAVLRGTKFWLPVYILFFLQHLPLEQVLLLEAIYYAAVMGMEVPSGYFSDRIGRRPTLVISSVAMAAAYALFLCSSGFAPFAVGQALLAMGVAFNSGTDASLHFDALACLGREDEYGDREASVSRLAFYASAAGAVGGGLCGLINVRLAYIPALVSALASFAIVLRMAEPTLRGVRREPAPGFIRDARAMISRLNHPVLRYLFEFYVLMTVLNHIPYEFYQPYIDRLMAGEARLQDTPAITGLHVAGTMLVASWFAGASIRLRDRLGLRGVFFLAAAIQSVLILSMAAFTSWLVVALLILRSVPRGLMTAPLNAAAAPLLSRNQRATYFSLQSLAGRLSFSLTLVAFSGISRALPWDPMRSSLLLGSLVAVGGLLLLLRRTPRGRSVEGIRTEEPLDVMRPIVDPTVPPPGKPIPTSRREVRS